MLETEADFTEALMFFLLSPGVQWVWPLRIYPHESKAATSSRQIVYSACDPEETTDSQFNYFLLITH